MGNTNTHLQYHSREPGLSPTHALATPTVKIPEGNKRMKSTKGVINTIRRRDCDW